MKDRASFTAAWVAGCRGLGMRLPDGARLADDPYGARFAPPGMQSVGRVLKPFVLYMQVRTRTLDDVLLDFVRDDGSQVVLLGAGFDCRALRFAHELAQATVFEVDHPATQARKREVLAADTGAHTEYLAWDFENQHLSDLPAALAERGHDARQPSLTIWEGVTMYLSEEAIDACVRAIAQYSAPRSVLALTYMDRRALDHPTAGERVLRRFVARVGEPFRFGWEPDELPRWMGGRGFWLRRDSNMTELAQSLLPQRYALGKRAAGRRIAVAQRM